MSLEDNLVSGVNEALDDAEKVWNKVEPHFINERLEKAFSTLSAGEKIPSKIPGFPFVQEDEPQVADFIALVLDIRNSTNHLLQAISTKIAKASQLERVLYETTAINTAGSLIIENYQGGITEYLGDGFLALFRVKVVTNPSEVYDAYNSAKICMSTGLNVVNDIIYQRYSLPKLEIGIGMAYSKAIVTIVGHNKNLHAKALGECVYRASKLSDGRNEIFIDDRLEALWPVEKNGSLKFIQSRRGHDFNSFLITRNN